MKDLIFTGGRMSKKIAIFHNYLDNIGGAEMVTLILSREIGADIYTTNIDKEKIINMGFDDVVDRVYSIGKVPINAPYKHQAAMLRFRMLNLSGKYDFFIITGDWALAGAVKNKPNLWYIHSPIREIYDLHDYIYNNVMDWWQRPLFKIWSVTNRFINKNEIKHVGKMACNSKNTQKRVKKYLNSHATVVHPPVDTEKYSYKKSGDYWLSVNRLYYHKRVKMQVEAFSKMPDKKLIIVGCYEDAEHFKEYAKEVMDLQKDFDNIKILSWISSEKLLDLYANCRGFVATAMDEDFGLTPVESMASGKPVIASNEGGYKETVVNGKTGILIDDINSDKLIKAVKEVDKNIKKGIYKEKCIERAKQFDTGVFVKKLMDMIE